MLARRPVGEVERARFRAAHQLVPQRERIGAAGCVTRTTCAPSSASTRPVSGAAHVDPNTTTRAPSRRVAHGPAHRRCRRGRQLAPPPPGASRHPPRHRPPRPRAARCHRPTTPPSPRSRPRPWAGPGAPSRRRRGAAAVAGAGRRNRAAPAEQRDPSASHSSLAARRATQRRVPRDDGAHSPSNSGARFSKKAAMPSARSRRRREQQVQVGLEPVPVGHREVATPEDGLACRRLRRGAPAASRSASSRATERVVGADAMPLRSSGRRRPPHRSRACATRPRRRPLE